MDDTEIPRDTPEPGADAVGHDQDSEATMNAPDSERPDGLDGVDDLEDDESMGGDGSPS